MPSLGPKRTYPCVQYTNLAFSFVFESLLGDSILFEKMLFERNIIYIYTRILFIGGVPVFAITTILLFPDQKGKLALTPPQKGKNKSFLLLNEKVNRPLLLPEKEQVIFTANAGDSKEISLRRTLGISKWGL